MSIYLISNFIYLNKKLNKLNTRLFLPLTQENDSLKPGSKYYNF